MIGSILPGLAEGPQPSVFGQKFARAENRPNATDLSRNDSMGGGQRYG